MADTKMTSEAPTRRSEVGTILRRRRESLDLELTGVAKTLRIRREYLAALENDTLEGMPGPAYAMGFLRTYSEYLGLDGLEMVRRYKASTDALNDKPNLTFPMPLTKRGVPGGGLFLLTVIILIGLGYGTWYYISSSHHATLATVEPVPAPLAAIAPPPAATPSPTTADTAKPAIAPDTSPPSAPAPPPTGSSTTAPASSPLNVEPAATPSPDAPAHSFNTASIVPPVSNAAPAAPPASTDPAPAPAHVPASVPASAPASPPPAPQASTGDAAPAHVYGETSAARIVIRATGKSWIQVVGPDGKVLTTRVMLAGDVYNAPDRNGLIMWAGNAGALQVSLDGKRMPALGAPGEVKRHIALNPTSLANGTAASAQ